MKFFLMIIIITARVFNNNGGVNAINDGAKISFMIRSLVAGHFRAVFLPLVISRQHVRHFLLHAVSQIYN